MVEDYTGLAALAWDLYSRDESDEYSGQGAVPDYQFLLQLLEVHPGPALDVGCGTGRLLLPLLGAQFDVEGVDASAEMLAICERRASERGLMPALYHQMMQDLDLPRRYRTIFVSCGTFHLLVDRAAAFAALRRFYHHLQPDGLLVLITYDYLHVLVEGAKGVRRQHWQSRLPNGDVLSKEGVIASYDLYEQTVDVQVRYRLLRHGLVVDEQLVATPQRWYGRYELALMLEQAGFRDVQITGDYGFADATDEHAVRAFLCYK